MRATAGKPPGISQIHLDGDKNTTGVLLERPLESLEGNQWKVDVQVVVRGLLGDALAVYGEEEMPVWRVRVLLKCLDFVYHEGIVVWRALRKWGKR
jgi:hypothetical protein